MMGDMKALASALAMVLIGLTGVWLWFDATSTASEETTGVVIVADAGAEATSSAQVSGQVSGQVPGQEEAATETAQAGGSLEAAQTAEEQLPAADEIDDTVVAATISSLRGVFNGLRVGSQTLSEDMRTAADEVLAQEKADEAARKKEKEKAAAQPAPRPQPQPAPQPVPVQPAPVTGGPPGPCWEWDDDEWEYECDDEWEDYWDDYLDDLYDDDDDDDDDD